MTWRQAGARPSPVHRPSSSSGGELRRAGRDYPRRPCRVLPADAARRGHGAAAAAPRRTAGIEVYMLRRKPSMAFAPGAFVVPGRLGGPPGRRRARWPGPARTPRSGAGLDAPPALARALVCAAVRETFEESGVLLAGPVRRHRGGRHQRGGLGGGPAALLDRSLSLAELLARRGLVLAVGPAAALVAVDHPGDRGAPVRHQVLRRRAAARQRTRDVGGEAEEVAWTRPAAAIRPLGPAN